MDFFTIAIIVVVGIVALVLISLFLDFLLTNWIISKIISEISSIVSLINSFIFVSALSSGEDTNGALVYIICTVLGWCFFLSATIFDTEFEGWEINFTNDGYTEKPIFSGGFWGNLGAAVLATVVTLFIGLGGEFYAIFFIVPILLLLINTVSMIYGIANY